MKQVVFFPLELFASPPRGCCFCGQRVCFPAHAVITFQRLFGCRLVFFKTQHAAAVAAQCVIHSEDNQEFVVHPAPGPEEVK
jgi:hypothetical protein